MPITLYAVRDKKGNLIFFPEAPRYSEEIDGFICRFGEFILPRSAYKKITRELSSLIKLDTDILEFNVMLIPNKAA